MRGTRLACLSLLMALLSASCRKAPSAPPNVVLVTIDTLRADRLGCYGHSNAETPTIDRLAREGTMFERIYAPSPLTLPSHATMMTGLDPEAHGLVDNGVSPVRFVVPTLAERFRNAGYDTAGFVASFVLNRMFGLDRGFSVYDDGPPEESELRGLFSKTAPGSERVDAAISWLRRPRSKPFFLWIHLFDVHAPHVPPPGFERRYAANPYDGEVAYADAQVRRVVDFLDSARLATSTIVVVTSDHGEGLGDHGEATHGILLYDSTLHVPLVIRGPGVDQERREGALGGLVDLAPTLLGLARLESPPTSGRNLFASASGDDVRTIWSMARHGERQFGSARLEAIHHGPWKLIAGFETELYDVDRDRGETTNLASERRADVRELSRILEEKREDLRRREVTGSEPSPATREALGALGYLSRPSTARDREERPGDPREVLVELDRHAGILGALEKGDGVEAERLARLALDAGSGRADTLTELGRALELQGKLRDAMKVYDGVASSPEPRMRALVRLVATARRLGEAEREHGAASRLVELFPSHAPSRRILASALLSLGRSDDAKATYRASLELAPESWEGREAWARALVRDGEFGLAAPLIATLVGERSASPEGLGLAALQDERAGRLAAGLEKLDSAIAERPDAPELFADRARIRRSSGDESGAKADLARLAELWPRAPELVKPKAREGK